MSIVRKFGKPDLFITFTRNLQWEEITSALLLDQKASDRPDLIVRVFRLKLKELLSDPIKRQVFGKPLAHVYTIDRVGSDYDCNRLHIFLQSQS